MKFKSNVNRKLNTKLIAIIALILASFGFMVNKLTIQETKAGFSYEKIEHTVNLTVTQDIYGSFKESVVNNVYNEFHKYFLP